MSATTAFLTGTERGDNGMAQTHPTRKIGIIAMVLMTLALTVSSVLAVSAHFIYANVTEVTANSITVSFKEAGLGNSLSSVNITLTGNAECINPGSKHPKASNKTGFLVSDTFNVSNGQATGSLKATASVAPSCSPPMTLAWTDLVVHDYQFDDSIAIPGTFYFTP
jgi:hypothetical protein